MAAFPAVLAQATIHKSDSLSSRPGRCPVLFHNSRCLQSSRCSIDIIGFEKEDKTALRYFSNLPPASNAAPRLLFALQRPPVSKPARVSIINKTKGMPGEGTVSCVSKIEGEFGFRGSFAELPVRLSIAADSLLVLPITWRSQGKWRMKMFQNVMDKVVTLSPTTAPVLASQLHSCIQPTILAWLPSTITKDACLLNLPRNGQMVVKDAKLRDELAQEHNLLCFEMEATGALAGFPSKEIRRIFIRGRVGVGKTTFRKKIVDEFLYQQRWNDIFDRLLWIPLRHLRERTGAHGYTFEHLFCDLYFPKECGRDSSKALWKACKLPNGLKSLFLLDGLDGILYDISSHSDTHRFLKYLMDQPNVIVTARPSTAVSATFLPFDIELETIGFGSDQVDTYVQKVEPERADAIRSYVDYDPLVGDLIRIPIQLDVLCYSWGDMTEEVPETMTDLYRAIEKSLWRKDILRLEKKVDGQLVTKTDLGHPDCARDLVQDEASFLEYFVFTGMCNGVVVFDASFRSAVSKQMHPGTMIERTLSIVSYLRSSDPSVSAKSRTYNFLHLTLEETHKPYHQSLAVASYEKDEMETREFFAKYEYSVRYVIVWRFAVGLLSSEAAEAETETVAFFEALSSEPLDPLSPSHQRLTIHYLSELPSSNVLGLWSCGGIYWKKRISVWLDFQIKTSKRPIAASLVEEIEFPPMAIDQSNLPSEAAGAAIASLDGSSSNIRHAVVETLSRQINLRLEAANAVVLCHDDHDPDVRRAAAYALWDSLPLRLCLASQVNLQRPLTALRNLLTTKKNTEFRRTVIKSSDDRSVLPPHIDDSIMAHLDNQDVHTKKAVFEALCIQQDLPKDAIDRIVAYLDDQEAHTREGAVKVSRSQRHPPQDAINGILVCFNDTDGRVRRTAVRALGSPSFSNQRPKAASTLKALFDNKDADVRRAAVETQSSCSFSSKRPETVSALVAHLENKNGGIRRAANEALHNLLVLNQKVGN
ncbi:uncharacterized protein GLRG_07437 [Colletotrichum graminicola M1.001]|uniref:Uncharacterized protein n=1 Tax=Colletotrichum graminicola (strain M1.001 / M2 / FGSC 10212) TaxID=645133 RepID=E3QN55_COLGM|nr:uncharacterized protein GLRG_07437 [Colletotrichum graminicola M1.001]EFQ32293.1 hypothetical protein GLRG_07437 [Colletotrichum graminicola M1.001]